MSVVVVHGSIIVAFVAFLVIDKSVYDISHQKCSIANMLFFACKSTNEIECTIS